MKFSRIIICFGFLGLLYQGVGIAQYPDKMCNSFKVYVTGSGLEKIKKLTANLLGQPDKTIVSGKRIELGESGGAETGHNSNNVTFKYAGMPILQAHFDKDACSWSQTTARPGDGKFNTEDFKPTPNIIGGKVAFKASWGNKKTNCIEVGVNIYHKCDPQEVGEIDVSVELIGPKPDIF